MSDESSPPRFHIADIRPVPDDATLAAITTALHETWPTPTIDPAPDVVVQANWRFGLRPWHQRPIPRRTWGRPGPR